MRKSHRIADRAHSFVDMFLWYFTLYIYIHIYIMHLNKHVGECH